MFDQSNFAPVGANSTDTPATFSYKTDDAIGTVMGASYFVSKQDQLNEGDILFIQAADGFVIAEVGSDTSSTSIVQQALANRVVINSATDFPEAVGGVIPLAANTEYYIGSSTVDVGTNRFTTQAGTVISGALGASILTSSTTGDLFTGGDGGLLFINGLVIVAASARVFNHADTVQGSTLIVVKDVLAFCDSIGTFTGLSGVNISNAQFDCTTTGAYFAGTVDLLSFRQVSLNTTSATFKGIDLNSSVSSVIEFEDLAVTGVSGSIGISGLASSGNVASGSIASVKSCEFLGGMTDLETITTDDIRWVFRDNSPTKDTLGIALISFAGNSTETVISTINTPVIVNATWSEVEASLFSTTSGGRATYIAERSAHIDVGITLGLRTATGTALDVTIYLALNGSVIAASALQFEAAGNKPQVVSLPWHLDLDQNDYLEVFIENNTSTVNFIVETGILRAS